MEVPEYHLTMEFLKVLSYEIWCQNIKSSAQFFKKNRHLTQFFGSEGVLFETIHIIDVTFAFVFYHLSIGRIRSY